jgi:hypothetical protein
LINDEALCAAEMKAKIMRADDILYKTAVLRVISAKDIIYSRLKTSLKCNYSGVLLPWNLLLLLRMIITSFA